MRRLTRLFSWRQLSRSDPRIFLRYSRYDQPQVWPDEQRPRAGGEELHLSGPPHLGALQCARAAWTILVALTTRVAQTAQVVRTAAPEPLLQHARYLQLHRQTVARQRHAVAVDHEANRILPFHPLIRSEIGARLAASGNTPALHSTPKSADKCGVRRGPENRNFNVQL